MATISQSEVSAFLACERKHFYQYTMGSDRRKQSDALARGKLGHSALDIVWRDFMSDVPEEKTKTKVSEFLLNAADLTLAAEVSRCIDWYFKVKPLAGWEISAYEKEFVFQSTDDLSFPFIPDLLIRNPAGRIYLADTKFNYEFFSPVETGLSSQLPK